jgi:tetratricopeptide (TPR) repeat protein
MRMEVLNQTADPARPSISLCMMVKDEEAFLPGCLESVKNYVDEIIVVDTGSTDKTVEISESYGARVYRHPWESDFSRHRNQSLSYATGDWVLIMDADEELRQGSGPRIRQAVETPDVDSIMVFVINYFNQRKGQSLINQIRLIKREAGIHYSGIVHNQLTGHRATGAAPIWIHHYGYDLTPDLMRAKFVRTSTLLKKRISEEPENYRHYHDLAVSYSMNQMHDEAVSSGLKAIELAAMTEKKGGVLILWTYFIVASSYLLGKEPRQAATWSLQAIERFPDHLDSCFILAMACRDLKEWDRVIEAGSRYLEILDALERDPSIAGYIVLNTTGEAWKIRLAIGESHLEKESRIEAGVFFREALSSAPVRAECLKRIGDSYRNRQLWNEAEIHYRSALRERSDIPGLLPALALCAERLGKKAEATQIYEKWLEEDPPSLEAMVNLGRLLEEQGMEDRARTVYEKAFQKEPRLVPVSLRLAEMAVRSGEIEPCLRYCEAILGALKIPANKTLESLADLSEIFLLIGHTLDKTGREELFRQATDIALMLNPKLIEGGRETQRD